MKKRKLISIDHRTILLVLVDNRKNNVWSLEPLGGKWKPGSRPEGRSHCDSGNTSFFNDSSSEEECESLNNQKKDSQRNVSQSLENNWNDRRIIGTNDWNIVKQTDDYVVKHKSNEEINIDQNESEFVCKLCGFGAKNSFDLLKHYLNTSNHSSNEVFSSESIPKNESNLMRNLSFVCRICSFYTNQPNNYFWHLTTSSHSQNVSDRGIHFKCKLCDQVCADIKKLTEHMENNQNNHAMSSGPLIVCEANKVAVKAFTNSSNDSVKSFECDFCFKKFRFKTQLKRHTLSEHIQRVAFPDLIKSNFIGDNPKYSCAQCDFKTDTLSIDLLHSVNHQMPIISTEEHRKRQMSKSCKSIRRSEDRYKCPLCDNTYISRKLKKHINTHLNKTLFECLKCDKKFAKLDYLRKHEKSHTNIRNEVCDKCGMKFTQKRILVMHMKTHLANRERAFVCQICGAMFHTKTVRDDHQKRHLPKESRPFKCKYDGCRYSFVKKAELLSHSKTHSDPEEKPLLCDRCPYKTKSIFTLRKHYRQHTGEKVFQCVECDFKTYVSSNMCRHKRIHSGEKPYGCPYCDYRCNSQENIRKHILKTNKHKGLYVYPCVHCDHKTNLFADYRKHLEQSHSDLYSSEQIDRLVSHLFTKNI